MLGECLKQPFVVCMSKSKSVESLSTTATTPRRNGPNKMVIIRGWCLLNRGQF